MADAPIHLETLARGPQKRINETYRFALVVLGSFCCICTSFSFAFNLISTPMQQKYNFSGRDLATVQVVGLVFQYFVMHYAFLYDMFGPIIPTICCTVMLPLGTMLFALCFRGTIAGSVVKLSVFNAFICGGCMVFDLIACVTVLAHFPANRGPVIALLKTYTGLGSAIVGCLKLGFFGSHVDQYFFFLMALSLVVGIIALCIMRLPSYHLTGWERRRLPEDEQQKRLARKAQYLKQRPQMKRFIHGFSCLIFLIIFLVTQSALVQYLNLGRSKTIAFACVTVFVMAVYLLVAAPLPWYRDRAQEEKERVEAEEGLVEGEAVDAPHGGDNSQSDKDFHTSVDESARHPDALSDALADAEVHKRKKKVETEVDYMAPQYPNSFLRNLLSPELWCIFWTMLVVLGTELVIIFNATPILGALSGKTPDTNMSTLLTVLNGVGSAVGRLSMSGFEIWTQKRPAENRIPITIALFPPTGSIIICLVLFLALPADALPLPYVIAALGNGFLAATSVLVTHTIYAKDQAKHYNFLYIASMISAICLVRFLYAEWYTVQSEKLGVLVCHKKRCVIMPLCVCLGLCVTAFASDIFVHLRYRSYCKRVLAERRRVREEAEFDMVEDLANIGNLAMKTEAPYDEGNDESNDNNGNGNGADAHSRRSA